MEEDGNGNQNSTRNKAVREEDGNGSQDTTGNKATGNETLGHSSKFSKCVKSSGICQVTGGPTTLLASSHILPFSSHKRDNQKVNQYLELIRALFGPDALQRLVENVLNGGKEGERNINRLDNGIALQNQVHKGWDSMKFFLEVCWDTYNPSTNEVIRYPYS